ncbi:MAG: hypothetical protein GY855_07060 [candidate division Zixibacteria bacterium]|nr:hypothetical protein [candidate division Zixibacteria bacterium]
MLQLVTKKIALLLGLPLILLVLSGAIAKAEIIEYPIAMLPTINTSPAAMGMGGCSINLLNEQSGQYNPAAPGLFYMHRYLSISFPYKTKLINDVYVNSLNIGGAFTRSLFNKAGERVPEVCASIGYSRCKISYSFNDHEYTTTDNNQLHFYELADIYTLSFGIDYYVRVGLGCSIKSIESALPLYSPYGSSSVLKGEGHAYDLGVIVQIPLHEIVPYKIRLDTVYDYFLNFELTPTIAYVHSNLGPQIKYKVWDYSKKLPEASKMGASVYTSAKINNSVVLSVLFAVEKEAQVRRTGPWLKDEKFYIERYGYEFCLMGCAYFRKGHFKDDVGLIRATGDYDTHGFGFRLQGLLSWLKTSRTVRLNGGLIEFVYDNIDVSFDYAQYEDSNYKGSTRFTKISLSF